MAEQIEKIIFSFRDRSFSILDRLRIEKSRLWVEKTHLWVEKTAQIIFGLLESNYTRKVSLEMAPLPNKVTTMSLDQVWKNISPKYMMPTKYQKSSFQQDQIDFGKFRKNLILGGWNTLPVVIHGRAVLARQNEVEFSDTPFLFLEMILAQVTFLQQNTS